MKKLIPLSLFLFSFNFSLRAQLFTQNFESGIFPPTNWIVEPPTGRWLLATFGAQGGIDFYLNPFTVNPHSGVWSAEYMPAAGAGGTRIFEFMSDVINLTNGGPHIIKFWFHQDNGRPTRQDSIAVYINTTQSSVGAIRLGNAPRVISANSQPQQQWNEYYFNIPVNFNSATNYIILKPYNHLGNNMFIDDIAIESVPSVCLPTTDCSGNVISLFRLKGENSQELNINTGNVCNSPTSYVDSTDHPIVIRMSLGRSYWGQVQCSAPLNTIAIWIDYNNNGIFETSEKVMNNLAVGSSLTNINLFIPPGAALGNHRMRVRNVNNPSGPIDACAPYTNGETEDYIVNIVNGSIPYTVATYTPTGNCDVSAGSLTVDAISNNNNASIPLVDSNNAIIAQLYPDGNDLGKVTASYYKNSGAVRIQGGRYYLDRNLTISVTTQPVTPYRLKYYFLSAELAALIAQAGSGVASTADIICTKNGNACLSTIDISSPSTLNIPTGNGTLGTNLFVDMAGLTSFSSFYLHGGSSVLPIKVEYFNGHKQGNNHLLNWKVNCTGSPFVTLSIEVSADSRNFASIYSARETALSCEQPFSFLNTQASAGISYYRLKMIDDNNIVTYSNIIALMNKAKGFEFVSVVPNPVTAGIFKLNITSAEHKKMDIEINDVARRILQTQSTNIIIGFNSMNINVSNLASGIYTIRGIVVGEKDKLIRFIKL
jgi:hypothetical protein